MRLVTRGFLGLNQSFLCSQQLCHCWPWSLSLSAVHPWGSLPAGECGDLLEDFLQKRQPPLLSASCTEAGRLAQWPERAPGWRSGELGSGPVSVTHKSREPGPVTCLPRAILAKGGLQTPEPQAHTEMGRKLSKRSPGEHLMKGGPNGLDPVLQDLERSWAQTSTPLPPELILCTCSPIFSICAKPPALLSCAHSARPELRRPHRHSVVVCSDRRACKEGRRWVCSNKGLSPHLWVPVGCEARSQGLCLAEMVGALPPSPLGHRGAPQEHPSHHSGAAGHREAGGTVSVVLQDLPGFLWTEMSWMGAREVAGKRSGKWRQRSRRGPISLPKLGGDGSGKGTQPTRGPSGDWDSQSRNTMVGRHKVSRPSSLFKSHCLFFSFF